MSAVAVYFLMIDLQKRIETLLLAMTVYFFHDGTPKTHLDLYVGGDDLMFDGNTRERR